MIGPLFLTAQSEKQTQADPGFCAHDFVMKQAASQSPGFLQRHQAMEDQLYQYSRKKKKVYRRYPRPSVEKSVFAAPYTLPVVVHIIHNGGVENITDAQVLQGIQDLNDAIGIPRNLSAMGLSGSDGPGIVEYALNDLAHAGNPRPMSADDYARVYETALN